METDDTDRGVLLCERFVLLQRISERVQTVLNQFFERAYCVCLSVTAAALERASRLLTILKLGKVILQVSLRTLRPGSDRVGMVLVRQTRWREFEEVGTGFL